MPSLRRFAAAAGAALLVTAHAPAVETRRLSLEQMVSSAPLIVVAKVTSKQALYDERMNAIWTEYVLAVEATWKGEHRPERRLRFFGGEVGGKSEGIVGQVSLDVGATYLLFVDDLEDAFAPVTGIGQGVFRVSAQGIVSADGELLTLSGEGIIRTRVPAGTVARERDPDPQRSTGRPSPLRSAQSEADALPQPASLQDVQRLLVEPLTRKP